VWTGIVVSGFCVDYFGVCQWLGNRFPFQLWLGADGLFLFLGLGLGTGLHVLNYDRGLGLVICSVDIAYEQAEGLWQRVGKSVLWIWVLEYITAAWKAFLLLFALEQASGLWQRVIVMCFRDYALEQALGGMAAAYGILFHG
jgi:hypothetical protein